MPDMKVTIKVPAQLVTGLQEQGVSDVGTFLESFLRQVEAEDLVEMSQDSLWVAGEDEALDDDEFEEDDLEDLEEDEDWDEDEDEDWEEDDEF